MPCRTGAVVRRRARVGEGVVCGTLMEPCLVHALRSRGATRRVRLDGHPTPYNYEPHYPVLRDPARMADRGPRIDAAQLLQLADFPADDGGDAPDVAREQPALSGLQCACKRVQQDVRVMI